MAGRRLLGRPVVLVDGCRTPFLRAQTDFAELTPYELGRIAVAGLLHRVSIEPRQVDLVVLGTVLSDPKTSNLAREVALAAGLDPSSAAYSVSAACASANVAIANSVNAIASQLADVAIAGGAELLSDPPIRVRRPLRKRLLAADKARGIRDYLALLRGLRPTDLLPELPAIAEFSTGLTMGQTAERLATRLRISREDQDAYALSSHRRSAAAASGGRFDDVAPAFPEPSYRMVSADNGIRADSSLEKLSSLRPAFDRRFGTVTAGNSSFLTDGAAVCLLMAEERAEALGLEPLARITALSLRAMDPLEELLLGPAFTIPDVLDAGGIALEDVEVLEIHEAFAVQLIACLRLLEEEAFCTGRLGRRAIVGRADPERVNAWGGSLAIGHPFGATGARLLSTCGRRMRESGARYGVVATCAAGALGSAFLLERAP